MGFKIKAGGDHMYTPDGRSVQKPPVGRGYEEDATRDRPHIQNPISPPDVTVRCAKGRHLVAIVSRTGPHWLVQPASGYYWGNLNNEKQPPIETACACGMIWVLDPEKLRDSWRARRSRVRVTEVEAAGVEPESYVYRSADTRAYPGRLSVHE